MSIHRPYLSILQVSTSDMGGGAELSAKNLFEAYRVQGHNSWLVVGQKRGCDPDIIELPNDRYRNSWVQWWNTFLLRNESVLSKIRGLGRATRMIRDIGDPECWFQNILGYDYFNYPATAHLLDLIPLTPNLVHCHNLHGGYFDLRYLSQLSQRIPTILNLADAWLLSGHCAFSLDCNRWRYGCGECPDLTLFPTINRDATAYNWNRKRNLFRQCKVYVVTPSLWLLRRVQESIVAPAIIEARVIPNGVDTGCFFPKTKDSARNQLGLPVDAEILIMAANGLRNNIWKDFKTLQDAIDLLGRLRPFKKILVLAVGESGSEERRGNVLLQFVSFQKEPKTLANYYQAADLYVHAARMESFGNVLLEARACGTPVVATAVGGIPEHVNSLHFEFAERRIRSYDASRAHGILTPPGDSMALANALAFLLDNTALRHRLGLNGIRDVQMNYSLSVQAEKFLNWYYEILAKFMRDGLNDSDQVRPGING